MRRGTHLAVVGVVLLGGLIVTTGGAQVVGAVASSEQELDGVWESVERSRGGIGTSYEFKATGTVCVSPGAMVDFDYQLEGNTVTITSAESGEQPVMTMVLDPEQDLLIPQGVGSEAQLPMERVSGRGAGEGSVVGTWKPTETESDSDLPEEARQGELAIRKNARQTFTADGRVLLRIPFRTDCGSYTVIGNKLTLVIVGQASKMDFRLEGDTLILVSPEGAEGVFRRREGVVNSPTREGAASANPLESEDPPTCV